MLDIFVFLEAPCSTSGPPNYSSHPPALPTLAPLKPLPLLFLLFLGISMDIDAAQEAWPLLLHNCYYCRETGHLMKDFPYQLNV